MLMLMTPFSPCQKATSTTSVVPYKLVYHHGLHLSPFSAVCVSGSDRELPKSIGKAIDSWLAGFAHTPSRTQATHRFHQARTCSNVLPCRKMCLVGSFHLIEQEISIFLHRKHLGGAALSNFVVANAPPSINILRLLPP